MNKYTTPVFVQTQVPSEDPAALACVAVRAVGERLRATPLPQIFYYECAYKLVLECVGFTIAAYFERISALRVISRVSLESSFLEASFLVLGCV